MSFSWFRDAQTSFNREIAIIRACGEAGVATAKNQTALSDPDSFQGTRHSGTAGGGEEAAYARADLPAVCDFKDQRLPDSQDFRASRLRGADTGWQLPAGIPPEEDALRFRRTERGDALLGGSDEQPASRRVIVRN